MKLGIAAIFKNEYPYILEWIAYHKNLGVDKFYIADNISDDGSSELLQALDEIDIITRIPFPRVGEGGPQAPAYNHIIKNFGHEVDILGFIDADEFVVSKNGLKKDLKSFFNNDEYGAIGLNWKLYGSGGSFFSSEGLVIERFTQHAKLESYGNRHIKTFLKPSFVEMMKIHECTLTKGRYCNSINNDVLFDETNAKTTVVTHQNLFVNHYVVKSRVEHFINKRKKGSAAGLVSREKGINYFKVHDITDDTTRFETQLIDTVKLGINKLKQRILKETSFMRLGKGHVDVNYDNNTITGWVTGEEHVPQFVLLIVDGKEFKVPVNKERMDVHKKGISLELVCGFNFPYRGELKGKDIKAFIYGSVQPLKVKS